MPDAKVKKATASFQTQGRLLQELGERLVAKADVALLELVKNAYDADASRCCVKCNSELIEISDDGHGMTEREFLDNWMHIATPDKQRQRQSRYYGRNVTGSKGIGRFAVRFLGRHLHLETVAAIAGRSRARTLLSVAFDWEKIDAAAQLHTVKIPYEVRPVPEDRQSGTRLIIGKLRNPDVDVSKKMRTELLSLISPYSGLESGGFVRSAGLSKDPGFAVVLPETEAEGQKDLAAAVLRNALATVRIEHKGDRTTFIVRHKDGRVLLQQTPIRPSHISKGFFADIRYFPRRAGMFSGAEVDGRVAWRWIKEHCGVGVVDHGFRIRPYGFPDDDWLNLSWDSAHNKRDWRAALMKELYPIPATASSQAKLNPMLYLPNFHQLAGAVFVESSPGSAPTRPTDLTPSMDREGFVDNEAFRELHELVRAGLEMLAYADHQEQRRLQEEKREADVKQFHADLRKAAAYVRTVPGLSPDDRQMVVTQFTSLARQLDDVENYYQIAASKLDIMGLLGVMAGFVTHEMQLLLNGLDRLLVKLRRSFGKQRDIAPLVSEIEETRSAIVGQLDYSAAFIGSIQDRRVANEPINSSAALDLVKRQFRHFAEDRGIAVDLDVEDGLMAPPLPRALYTGVIMNLFTNALKAAIGGHEADPKPRVVMKAWNEQKWHIVEVADTGVGIPPALQKRIWDPLFTTTSGQDYNPLGSGMGLGLALVKRVVAEVKGRVHLVDPPPGFKTCFRVEFPRK